LKLGSQLINSLENYKKSFNEKNLDIDTPLFSIFFVQKILLFNVEKLIFEKLYFEKLYIVFKTKASKIFDILSWMMLQMTAHKTS
jgi:hypothetical protein